jgi:hypothetical protein
MARNSCGKEIDNRIKFVEESGNMPQNLSISKSDLPLFLTN